jgi:hypothetical protein
MVGPYAGVECLCVTLLLPFPLPRATRAMVIRRLSRGEEPRSPMDGLWTVVVLEGAVRWK